MPPYIPIVARGLAAGAEAGQQQGGGFIPLAERGRARMERRAKTGVGGFLNELTFIVDRPTKAVQDLLRGRPGRAIAGIGQFLAEIGTLGAAPDDLLIDPADDAQWGIIADILLDPLTYISFGGTAYAKVGMKAAKLFKHGKTAAKTVAGQKAIAIHMQSIMNKLMKLRTPQLAKSVAKKLGTTVDDVLKNPQLMKDELKASLSKHIDPLFKGAGTEVIEEGVIKKAIGGVAREFEDVGKVVTTPAFREGTMWGLDQIAAILPLDAFGLVPKLGGGRSFRRLLEGTGLLTPRRILPGGIPLPGGKLVGDMPRILQKLGGYTDAEKKLGIGTQNILYALPGVAILRSIKAGPVGVAVGRAFKKKQAGTLVGGELAEQYFADLASAVEQTERKVLRITKGVDLDTLTQYDMMKQVKIDTGRRQLWAKEQNLDYAKLEAAHAEAVGELNRIADGVNLAPHALSDAGQRMLNQINDALVAQNKAPLSSRKLLLEAYRAGGNLDTNIMTAFDDAARSVGMPELSLMDPLVTTERMAARRITAVEESQVKTLMKLAVDDAKTSALNKLEGQARALLGEDVWRNVNRLRPEQVAPLTGEHVSRLKQRLAEEGLLKVEREAIEGEIKRLEAKYPIGAGGAGTAADIMGPGEFFSEGLSEANRVSKLGDSFADIAGRKVLPHLEDEYTQIRRLHRGLKDELAKLRDPMSESTDVSKLNRISAELDRRIKDYYEIAGPMRKFPLRDVAREGPEEIVPAAREVVEEAPVVERVAPEIVEEAVEELPAMSPARINQKIAANTRALKGARDALKKDPRNFTLHRQLTGFVTERKALLAARAKQYGGEAGALFPRKPGRTLTEVIKDELADFGFSATDDIYEGGKAGYVDGHQIVQKLGGLKSPAARELVERLDTLDEALRLAEKSGDVQHIQSTLENVESAIDRAVKRTVDQLGMEMTEAIPAGFLDEVEYRPVREVLPDVEKGIPGAEELGTLTTRTLTKRAENLTARLNNPKLTGPEAARIEADLQRTLKEINSRQAPRPGPGTPTPEEMASLKKANEILKEYGLEDVADQVNAAEDALAAKGIDVEGMRTEMLGQAEEGLEIARRKKELAAFDQGGDMLKLVNKRNATANRLEQLYLAAKRGDEVKDLAGKISEAEILLQDTKTQIKQVARQMREGRRGAGIPQLNAMLDEIVEMEKVGAPASEIQALQKRWRELRKARQSAFRKLEEKGGGAVAGPSPAGTDFGTMKHMEDMGPIRGGDAYGQAVAKGPEKFKGLLDKELEAFIKRERAGMRKPGAVVRAMDRFNKEFLAIPSILRRLAKVKAGGDIADAERVYKEWMNSGIIKGLHKVFVDWFKFRGQAGFKSLVTVGIGPVMWPAFHVRNAMTMASQGLMHEATNLEKGTRSAITALTVAADGILNMLAFPLRGKVPIEKLALFSRATGNKVAQVAWAAAFGKELPAALKGAKIIEKFRVTDDIAKVINKVGQRTVKVGEETFLRADELLQLATENNVFAGFSKGELKLRELGRGVAFAPAVGEAVESSGRLAMFKNLLEEGEDALDAGVMVREIMYDYASVASPTDKALRTVFPFFKFTQAALESVVKTAVKTPGRISMPLKVLRPTGYGDDLKLELAGGTVGLGVPTVLDELARLGSKEGLARTIEKNLANLTPALTMPGQLVTRRSFYRGKPLEVYDAILMQPFGRAISMANQLSDGDIRAFVGDTYKWKERSLIERILPVLTGLRPEEVAKEDKLLTQIKFKLRNMLETGTEASLRSFRIFYTRPDAPEWLVDLVKDYNKARRTQGETRKRKSLLEQFKK